MHQRVHYGPPWFSFDRTSRSPIFVAKPFRTLHQRIIFEPLIYIHIHIYINIHFFYSQILKMIHGEGDDTRSAGTVRRILPGEFTSGVLGRMSSSMHVLCDPSSSEEDMKHCEQCWSCRLKLYRICIYIYIIYIYYHYTILYI